MKKMLWVLAVISMLIGVAAMALRGRSYRLHDKVYCSHDTQASFAGQVLRRNSGWSLESDSGELRLMSDENIHGIDYPPMEQGPLPRLPWSPTAGWTYGFRTDRHLLTGFIFFGGVGVSGAFIQINNSRPIFRIRLIWIAVVTAMCAIGFVKAGCWRMRQRMGFAPVMSAIRPGSTLTPPTP